MQKKEKGITLIALIITIIVMLILVGVTVTIALNGGLFDTAKAAAKGTQKAEDKEILQGAVLGALNENLTIASVDSLKNSLPATWTDVKEEIGDSYRVTSPKGNKFKVYEDGTIGDVMLNDYGFYYNADYVCYGYRVGDIYISKGTFTILENGNAILTTCQEGCEEGSSISISDWALNNLAVIENIEKNKLYTYEAAFNSKMMVMLNDTGDLISKSIINAEHIKYSDKTINVADVYNFTISEDGLSAILDGLDGKIFCIEEN